MIVVKPVHEVSWHVFAYLGGIQGLTNDCNGVSRFCSISSASEEKHIVIPRPVIVYLRRKENSSGVPPDVFLLDASETKNDEPRRHGSDGMLRERISTRQTFIHIHQSIIIASISNQVYCIISNWCMWKNMNCGISPCRVKTRVGRLEGPGLARRAGRIPAS